MQMRKIGYSGNSEYKTDIKKERERREQQRANVANDAKIMAWHVMN